MGKRGRGPNFGKDFRNGWEEYQVAGNFIHPCIGVPSRSEEEEVTSRREEEVFLTPTEEPSFRQRMLMIKIFVCIRGGFKGEGVQAPCPPPGTQIFAFLPYIDVVFFTNSCLCPPWKNPVSALGLYY